MSIDPTGSPNIRPGTPEGAPEAGAPGEGRGRTADRTRGDHVEISAEARSLAQQGGVERVPFTEARAAEVKDRLDQGYYDAPEIVRSIAERLVDSGDL